MTEIVYLNGSFVARAEALVPVYDHGFLYGYGIFETMRAYNGRIFLLQRHIERLLEAAAELKIDTGLTAAGLEEACRATLAANGLKEARLRLTVSRGEAGPFPGVSKKPTIVITASSYTPPPPPKYESGFRAALAVYPRLSQPPLYKLKTTSYLANVLARLDAEAAGLDEAIFLNECGHLTEGSASNIFLVRPSGGLATPSPDSGLLPGVTRRTVLELADEMRIASAEGQVRIADLEHFSEAFLTNSTMEIMPLVSVRDNEEKTITIGSGKPGPITRRLIAAYKEMVKRETS
jgi:branched-subunit amino acid aminotransferase/4-amino-4-deoxychorismate lyase